MIFGHYSIPIKTLNKSEIPPQLAAQPNTTVQQVVRVVHIMFIPIFPFEKTWVLKSNGESYKMNPEANRALSAAYGRGIPFYAFAGPILIALFFMVTSIGNCSRKRQQKVDYEQGNVNRMATFKSYVNEPSVNDYYHLKESDKKFIAKVSEVKKDSFVLAYPMDDQSSYRYDNSKKLAYFNNPNANVKLQSIAKEDILNILESKKDLDNMTDMGLLIPEEVGGINSLYLSYITRNSEHSIQKDYVDQALEEEVKAAFNYYVENRTPIGTSINLITQESRQLFLDLYNNTKLNDFVPEVGMLSTKYGDSPSIFRYYMYTKFIFMKEGKEDMKDEDILEELGFFLQLLDLGLWSIGLDGKDHVKNTNIKGISFSSPTEATLELSAASNLLVRSENIRYKAKMNKEDGEWKLDILSTFDFSNQQYYSTVRSGTLATKKTQLRATIVDELNNGGLGVTIPDIWKY